MRGAPLTGPRGAGSQTHALGRWLWGNGGANGWNSRDGAGMAHRAFFLAAFLFLKSVCAWPALVQLSRLCTGTRVLALAEVGVETWNIKRMCRRKRGFCCNGTKRRMEWFFSLAAWSLNGRTGP